MRFETKREREQRRKRQKRSAILGMVFAMLVVVGLGVLLWNGKKNIEAKNVEYESRLKSFRNRLMKKNSVQKSLMNIRSMCRRRSLRRRLPRINSDLYIQMR